jgi:hypothetical protein
MVLEMHLMLKLHITNLALDLVTILQIRQVLSPEMSAQIARTQRFTQINQISSGSKSDLIDTLGLSSLID